MGARRKRRYRPSTYQTYPREVDSTAECGANPIAEHAEESSAGMALPKVPWGGARPLPLSCDVCGADLNELYTSEPLADSVHRRRRVNRPRSEVVGV